MKRFAGDPEQLFSALEDLLSKGPVAVASTELAEALNCQLSGVYLRLRTLKEAGFITAAPCRLKNRAGRGCSGWYLTSSVRKAVLSTQSTSTKKSIYV